VIGHTVHPLPASARCRCFLLEYGLPPGLDESARVKALTGFWHTVQLSRSRTRPGRRATPPKRTRDGSGLWHNRQSHPPGDWRESPTPLPSPR
jgi:hypothetical protein